VAGFGLAGLFGKLLALSPLVIVAGRSGFAALALGILLALRRPAQGDSPWAWRAWWAGAPMGVLLAAHWWAFFQSVQVGTVAVALLSFSTFPVAVLALDASLGHGRPRPRDLAAALAALGGVAVIAPRFQLADASFRGLLWGLASGLAFAAMVVWNRSRVRHTPPLVLALVQNGVACLVLLPLAAASSSCPPAREWAGLAVLGVVFTAGTHGLFLQGLRSVPARLASLTCTLEPAYGILAGSLILHEIPGPRTLLGAAIILASVASVSLTRRC
jgi:drug/metabolite transporter (DMT)-like permease